MGTDFPEDLLRAKSILIGEKWLTVSDIEVGLDVLPGWVRIKTSGYESVSVRLESITAFKTLDLPTKVEPQRFEVWL